MPLFMRLMTGSSMEREVNMLGKFSTVSTETWPFHGKPYHITTGLPASQQALIGAMASSEATSRIQVRSLAPRRCFRWVTSDTKVSAGRGGDTDYDLSGI